MIKMTKVTIISGFLGAGKTTFIKKLLKDVYSGQKIVLIENEFGEIGIDGGFLKEAGITINEMNSGCICCSLVGDFAEALKKVKKEYDPDMIIIEPSGVGKLSDVIAAVENVKDEVGLELANFITVCDATKCKMYIKNFGEFYNNQVEHASTIVLSRTQNMDEQKLMDCVSLIKEHNDKAAVVTTPWDELSGEQIVSAMKNSSLVDELLETIEHEHHHHDDDDDECCHGHHHHHDDDDDDDDECCHGHHHDDDDDDECCHGHHHHNDDDDDEHEHHHHHHDDEEGECSCGHHHHHHHHADDVFNSWGVETPHKYDRDEIEAILKRLVMSEEFGVILRAKGMVPAKDGTWIYFDAVPGEYELREGAPEYTGKLCVIGTDVCEHSMKELFGL